MQREPGFYISPSQGVQLMALAEMLKADDLHIRLWDGDEWVVDETSAPALLLDVAQEIALQVNQND